MTLIDKNRLKTFKSECRSPFAAHYNA